MYHPVLKCHTAPSVHNAAPRSAHAVTGHAWAPLHKTSRLSAQVLAPRGRFSIELYMNYMKLVGQVQIGFRI